MTPVTQRLARWGLAAALVLLGLNGGCVTFALWETCGPKKSEGEELLRITVTKEDVAYFSVRYSNGDVVDYRCPLAIDPVFDSADDIEPLSKAEVLRQGLPANLTPGRRTVIREDPERTVRPGRHGGGKSGDAQLIFNRDCYGFLTVHSPPYDYYKNTHYIVIPSSSPYERRTARKIFCGALTPVTVAVDIATAPIQITYFLATLPETLGAIGIGHR